MKAMKVALLMFVTMFLLNTQTVSAETFVRVYDSGVYAMTKALEENGVPVTFFKKGPALDDGAIPYVHYPNFEKEIAILFNVNAEGYISDIVINPYSASMANYEKVVIQICKVLGMSDNEAKFLFDNRRSYQEVARVYCANKNRSFIMSEENINNGIFNTIMAIK